MPTSARHIPRQFTSNVDASCWSDLPERSASGASIRRPSASHPAWTKCAPGSSPIAPFAVKVIGVLRVKYDSQGSRVFGKKML